MVKLEAQLADHRSLLDLQERKVAPATAEAIAAQKKKVDTTAVENAQAESAVVLEACVLEVSLQTHARKEEARLARAGAAEVKAEEKSQRLEEICREQAAAWEAHLERLQCERTSREGA